MVVRVYKVLYYNVFGHEPYKEEIVSSCRLKYVYCIHRNNGLENSNPSIYICSTEALIPRALSSEICASAYESRASVNNYYLATSMFNVTIMG